MTGLVTHNQPKRRDARQPPSLGPARVLPGLWGSAARRPRDFASFSLLRGVNSDEFRLSHEGNPA